MKIKHLFLPFLLSISLHIGFITNNYVVQNNESLAFDDGTSSISLKFVSIPENIENFEPEVNQEENNEVTPYEITEDIPMVDQSDIIESVKNQNMFEFRKPDNLPNNIEVKKNENNINFEPLISEYIPKQNKSNEIKRLKEFEDEKNEINIIPSQTKRVPKNTEDTNSKDQNIKKNPKNVYEKQGVFTEAKSKNILRPIYPSFSRRNGEEGTVTLSVEISINGECVYVSVVKSSGYTRLDKAAVEALKKAQFIPAKKDGKAVKSKKKIAITFTLE